MLDSHQCKQSRFWERKTLSPESPATTSVVTVLHIFPVQRVAIPFIQDIKYTSSREILLLLQPSTLCFLLFLSNPRIKNVFLLGFMCIIPFLLMTITTAAISTIFHVAWDKFSNGVCKRETDSKSVYGDILLRSEIPKHLQFLVARTHFKERKEKKKHKIEYYTLYFQPRNWAADVGE